MKLLEVSLETNETSQTNFISITIPQVCFIIKELLVMIKNQLTERFVADFVGILPNICSKLQRSIVILKQTEDLQNREAVRLILRLIIAVFNWKEFQNRKYNNLLQGKNWFIIIMNIPNCTKILQLAASTFLKITRDILYRSFCGGS